MNIKQGGIALIKILAVSLLMPTAVMASCLDLKDTSWIAKTNDSVHRIEFIDNTRLSFESISKSDSYTTYDLDNAHEFSGESTYYKYDCHLVFFLPHRNKKVSQVSVYLTQSKGYGFYIYNGKETVLEMTQ